MKREDQKNKQEESFFEMRPWGENEIESIDTPLDYHNKKKKKKGASRPLFRSCKPHLGTSFRFAKSGKIPFKKRLFLVWLSFSFFSSIRELIVTGTVDYWKGIIYLLRAL